MLPLIISACIHVGFVQGGALKLEIAGQYGSGNLVHGSRVLGVFQSSVGSFVSLGDDGMIVGWDNKQGFYQWRQCVNELWVNQLEGTHSPDGTIIATSGEASGIQLWDIKNGRFLRKMQSSRKEGRVSFSIGGNRLVSEGGGIWNTEDGALVKRLESPRLRFPIYDRSGQYIVAGIEDGSILQIDLEKGATRSVAGHRSDFYGMAASEDRSRLISAGWDGSIRVWDFDTLELLKEYRKKVGVVPGIVADPTGGACATRNKDGNALVWRTDTGEDIKEIQVPGGVTSLYFGSSGDLLWGSSLGRIGAWSVRHNRSSLDNHYAVGKVTGAAVLDEERILTISGYRYVTIINRKDNGIIRKFELESGLSWVYWPGHNALIVGGRDGRLHQYDLLQGVNVRNIKIGAPKGEIISLALHPNGEDVFAGGKDGVIRLVSMKSGQEKMSYPGRNWVTSVAIGNKTGRMLAGYRDGVVIVWDMKSGKPTGEFTPTDYGVIDIICDPSEALALCLTAFRVFIIELESGEVMGVYEHDGVEAVRTMAMALLNASTALVGNAAGDLVCVDIKTAKEVGVFKGHRGPIRHIWVTEEGAILTASSDGLACLWVAKQ